jgi:protein gp37
VGENTKISWTDATWNPAWGCTKIGPGCDNCYAEKLASRYGFDVWGPDKSRRTFGDKHWNEPVNWNKKARETGKRIKVFCASMCDVFENHPIIDGLRDRLWNLIRETQWLDWQLLTKRPNRIKENLPNDWLGGYENVWLGTSVESGDFAWRADFLRELPAVIKFISCEPAIGPLDNLVLDGINWVIYGGESGPNFRDHDINWARNLRIRCLEANVAFFYKQSPGRTPGTEALLDGKEVKEFPVPRVDSRECALISRIP